MWLYIQRKWSNKSMRHMKLHIHNSQEVDSSQVFIYWWRYKANRLCILDGMSEIRRTSYVWTQWRCLWCEITWVHMVFPKMKSYKVRRGQEEVGWDPRSVIKNLSYNLIWISILGILIQSNELFRYLSI